MDISSNIRSVLSELPERTRLVAVSKTKSIQEMMEAYRAGQRIFGENKVQELVPKYQQLPKDIEWHLVGHLQTNKVKYIGQFIHYIHSVDSLGLLIEIDKQGKKNNRVINCLLQVYLAKEETKFGLTEQELYKLLDSPNLRTFGNIKIVGLMGMASNTDDKEQVRNEFRHLSKLFNELKTTRFIDNPEFKELSMGMSSDYTIAIEEGSTLVRIGGNIFGERDYTL